MPLDFNLPEDLADSVEVEYLDDEEIDNLENEEGLEEMEDEELPEDKSILTFSKHEKSVFTVTFNSDNTLAASGGEDDMAYLWEVSSGNVLLECTGHKDSVTQVKFSYDDKYLVTGDMSGLLQVWDVTEKKLKWCYECEELEWLLWHSSAHVLLCGVHSGGIYMFQIPQGNFKLYPSSGSSCNCGVLLPNGTNVAAGYEDGSIRLWDLKTMSIVNQSPRAENGEITNIYLNSDGKLLVACGLKSGAIVFKSNDCKVVANFKTDGSDEIETAAFCPEPDLPILATGSLNGVVCFWDLSRQALRHKIDLNSAITNICWGQNALLFVSSVDGIVYVFNGRSGLPIGEITGHTTAVLDFQITKDTKTLITSSDDTTCKIFDIPSNVMPI